MSEFERINLDDYIQTGEGGTALTYNHKDGKTLAKLFLPSMAADNAVREFRINQVVYESGLPTPKPIRLITDGTRFGAEYELIQPKRSFTRIISQEPDNWCRCQNASPCWPSRYTRLLPTRSGCRT